MRETMEKMVRQTQDEICAALEKLDHKTFHEDRWQRPGGGGGTSRVLQEGSIFEKAGVNVSVVEGVLPEAAIASMAGGKLKLEDFPSEQHRRFFATGVSVVVHPHNPHAPTAHCNYRYFEMNDGQTWWFGGGADLTPSYLYEEDVQHFHRVHKEACEPFDASYYPRFKQWCDEYFFIKHRGECRGVGGIFFDHLQQETASRDELFAFVAATAAAFVPSYVPLVERRKDQSYSGAEKRWQALRRGRYVEFNLVYDRGTTFGLQTGGRTESILMSLPLTARWEYDVQPDQESAEARLQAVLREPRPWV